MPKVAINYDAAHRIYSRMSRPDKRIGMKLGYQLWLNAAGPGKYELLYVNKWVKNEKENSVYDWVKGTPDQWSIRVVATYTPDLITFAMEDLRSDVQAVTGVRKSVKTKQKFLGAEWHYCGQVVRGEGPIQIRNGQLELVNPQRERIEDNDARKAQNALIKRVRNAIRVRAKLGAFNEEFFKTSETLHENKPPLFKTAEYLAMNDYAIRRSPAAFTAALEYVNVEDIDTFKPLAWLLNSKWFRSVHNGETFLEQFNNYLRNNKDLVKRAAGVVKFEHT